jgi:hypothetical protein
MAGSRRQAIRAGLAGLACLLLNGCVSTQIDEVPPSLETLRVLREQGVPAIGLGKFTLDPKLRNSAIIIRGSDIHPPKGKTFAEFLGSTFEAELRAAGKFDPAAPLRLEATLLESRGGENMSSGHAELGAEVRLARQGQVVFAKRYRAQTRWESDFIGALAIPEAFRQYNALYSQLVRQVFADPEFIAVARQ